MNVYVQALKDYYKCYEVIKSQLVMNLNYRWLLNVWYFSLVLIIAFVFVSWVHRTLIAHCDVLLIFFSSSYVNSFFQTPWIGAAPVTVSDGIYEVSGIKVVLSYD